MTTTKKSRTILSQLSMAILLTASLIACSGESSSNNGHDNSSSSNTDSPRTLTNANGETITVRQDPNDEDVRIIDGGSVTNLRFTCRDNPNGTINGIDEAEVCL